MVNLVNSPTINTDGNYNFVGTGKASPNILCTRPSTGFYMNYRGLPTKALANTPRVEFDENGQCLGILNEEGGTNVLLHSETHSESIWVRTGMSISKTKLVGDMSFSQLMETATTSRHGIQHILDTSQTQNTLQMYLHLPESQDALDYARTTCVVRLPLVDKAGVGEDAAWCKIDLLTGGYKTGVDGTAFQTANFVWQVKKYQSGVVRIYVFYKDSKPTTAQLFFSTATNLNAIENSPSYLGVDNRYVYVGGWQQSAGLGQGLQGLSYIPTTTASASRAADALSMKVPVGKNGGKYTIQMGFTPIRLVDKSRPADGTKYGYTRPTGKIFHSTATGVNTYSLFYNTGKMTIVKDNVYVNGLQVDFPDSTVDFKLIITQLGANTRIFGNGGASTTSPTSLAFTGEQTMYIGCGSSKGEQLTAYISNITIWADGVDEAVGRNISMV